MLYLAFWALAIMVFARSFTLVATNQNYAGRIADILLFGIYAAGAYGVWQVLP
jgi:hypothetical protein